MVDILVYLWACVHVYFSIFLRVHMSVCITECTVVHRRLTYLLVAKSFSGESNNQLSRSLNIEQKSEIKILTMSWPLI